MELKVCIGLCSPATVAVFVVVVWSAAFAVVSFVAMVSYVEQYSEALLE